MSSGSENEGPARKRFLTKYLHKDTSGRDDLQIANKVKMAAKKHL
jgi:hypothetical protein